MRIGVITDEVTQDFREALEKIGNGSINGILNFSDRKKKKENKE